MYLVFTRMPGESYRRRRTSLLLSSCEVFRALIKSLVSGGALVLVLFQNVPTKGCILLFTSHSRRARFHPQVTV